MMGVWCSWKASEGHRYGEAWKHWLLHVQDNSLLCAVFPWPGSGPHSKAVLSMSIYGQMILVSRGRNSQNKGGEVRNRGQRVCVCERHRHSTMILHLCSLPQLPSLQMPTGRLESLLLQTQSLQLGHWRGLV